jgi:hypothetical protein
MRDVTTAALITGFAALLALTGAAGVWLLVAAVLLVQLVFAYGWFRLLAVPDAGSGTAVAVAAGLAADVVLFADDRLRAEDADPSLAPTVGVLGLLFLAALLQQLVRRGGRPALTQSMSATVAGGALAVLAAAWLPALQSRAAFAGLAAGLAGAAVGGALMAAAGPRAVAMAAGAAGAAGVGAALGSVDDVVGALNGAALGLGSGVAAALAVAAVSQGLRRYTIRPATWDPARPPAHDPAGARLTAEDPALPTAVKEGAPLTAGTLPLALAAPVTYALGRLLVG